MREGRGGGDGGEHDLVRVEVDPDLEGRGEAAGGGVGGPCGGRSPEVAADPGDSVNISGGGGGGLQGGDLQVVSVSDLGALGGAEGGHP